MENAMHGQASILLTDQFPSNNHPLSSIYYAADGT